MKASWRRALRRALAASACPNCSRAGWLTWIGGWTVVYCYSCGKSGAVTATLYAIPTEAGSRSLADLHLTRKPDPSEG